MRGRGGAVGRRVGRQVSRATAVAEENAVPGTARYIRVSVVRRDCEGRAVRVVLAVFAAADHAFLVRALVPRRATVAGGVRVAVGA